jgi:hypothetical protein
MHLKIAMQKKILTLFFFLSLFSLNIKAQITWKVSKDYLFKLTETAAATNSSRYAIDSIESKGYLGISLPSSYAATDSPLNWTNNNNGQYAIVKDPQDISEDYTSFTADDPEGYITVFTGGRSYTDPMKIITIQNLENNQQYELSFDLIDVRELKSDNAEVVIMRIDDAYNPPGVTITSSLSPTVFGGNKKSTYTVAFYKGNGQTGSAAIFLKDFTKLYDATSAIGIKDVRLKEVITSNLISDIQKPLLGQTITLSLDKTYEGSETEFIWARRLAGSGEAFVDFDTTSTDEVTTIISENTEYQLRVGAETATLTLTLGTYNLQSSKNLPLLGESITLSLDKKYQGPATEFIWLSRPAGSTDPFVEFTTTTTPELTTRIPGNTEYQFMAGTETAELTLMLDTYTLQSSSYQPLSGNEITLSLDKTYQGFATEFIWSSRPAGSSEAFVEFTRTTTPEVTTTINEATEYQLQAESETFTITLQIQSKNDLLKIVALYPDTICKGSSNLLIAGGSLVTDAINTGNNFSLQLQWEKYDNKNGVWTLVKSSDSIHYQTKALTEDTRYRVTILNGYLGSHVTSDEFKIVVNSNCAEACGQLESQLIFHETFGFFLAENIYIDSKGKVRTKALTNDSIGNFWAPDPFGYVIPQADGGHDYAWNDPKNIDGTYFGEGEGNRCTPSRFSHLDSLYMPRTFRIEDSWYALLTTPYGGACAQNEAYWDGPDRTGNENGAMLFVNCGAAENTPIYMQKVDLSCPQSRFNLTVDLGNAVINTASLPVNIKVRILDRDGNLLKEEENVEGLLGSGDFNQSSWITLSLPIKLTSAVDQFYVQILNLNPPISGDEGKGNDILLDEIKFSVCLPKVTLLVNDMDPLAPQAIVSVCDSLPVVLKAHVGEDSKLLMVNPRYLFQYKDGSGVWKNISENVDDTEIEVKKNAPCFREGNVEFQVICAEETVMQKILAGTPLDQLEECDRYNYSTSQLTIENSYGGPMLPDTTILVCEGEIVGGENGLTGTRLWETPGWTHEWKWAWSVYSVDGHTVPEPSSDPADKVIKHTVDVTTLPDTLYFYAFDGETKESCYISQKIILKAKPTVSSDIILDSYAGCDSVVITANVPSDVALIWKMNGNPIDPSVVFVDPTNESRITIKPAQSQLPLSGKISAEVDTSRVVYCTIEPDIADFRIMAGESFDLKLEGTPESLCRVGGTSYDTITLKAIVSPEASAEDVENYYWYLGGSEIAQTPTEQDSLILSTDPANPYSHYLVAGAKMNFGVKVVDGQCFTIEQPSLEATLYMEVSESYTAKLESTDTMVCLTGSGDDDVIFTLKALLSAVDANSTGNVDANIKKYIWKVNGTTFAETGQGEGSYAVKKNDPAIARHFQFAAGTSSDFSVTAIDSICFDDNSAPSATLTMKFNESFTIDIVSENGNNVVCIPTLDNDMVLAKFVAVTTPEASAQHINKYVWKLGVEERVIETETNLLEISRDLILSLPEVVYGTATTIPLNVTVIDGICADKVTKDIELDIRFGGFVIDLTVDAEACLNETDKILLTAKFTPKVAIKGIDQYVWIENGNTIGTTLKADVIDNLTPPDSLITYQVDKSIAEHAHIFTTGYTAVFNVMANDETCGMRYAVAEQEVRVSEKYAIELDYLGSETEICLDNISEAEKQNTSPLITLQATVTPTGAANHIQEYIWTVKDQDNNIVKEGTTINSQFELFYNDLKDQIGKTLSFSVNSWDGICVTKESGDGEVTAGRTIKINSIYQLNLDVNTNGLDSICLGDIHNPTIPTDQVLITLTATSTPAAAINHITDYQWYVSVDGGTPELLKETKAGENTMTLTYSDLTNYIGRRLLFSVNSADGNCVELSDGNGRGQANREIFINSYYNLNLDVQSIADSLCLGDINNPPYQSTDVLITLTATSDPEGADRLISQYIWEVSVDGAAPVEIGRTPNGKNKYELTYAMLKQYIGHKLSFSVNSEDKFCVNLEDGYGKGSSETVITVLSLYNLDLKVEGVEDQLCLEDLNNPPFADGDVLIILTATSNPAAAAAHIQEYIWEVTVDGTLVELGRTPRGVNTYQLTYERLKQYIGSNLLFSVNSWDGNCVTIDDNNGRGKANRTIKINSKYNLRLDVSGVTDQLCLGDLSTNQYSNNDVLITLTATSDPAAAAGHIKGYRWEMTVDGATTTLPADDPTKNTYTLTYGMLKNYVGNSLLFSVNSWDDICVTEGDAWGRGTADRKIDINSTYQLNLTVDNLTGTLCIGDVDNPIYQPGEVLMTLTATSTPTAAGGHIKKYIWEVSENGGSFIEIGRTDGNTFGMTFADLKPYAGKTLDFRVNSWDGICVDVDDSYGRGDGVKMIIAQQFNVDIASTKNVLCSENDRLKLTATVTPITAIPLVKEYEWYSLNIETGVKTFLGETTAPEFEITTFTAGHYNFYVEVEDGICHTSANPSTSQLSDPITVSDVLIVSLRPSESTVCQGDEVTLTATSSGVPTLYEWYKDGQLKYSNAVNGDTSNEIPNLRVEEAQGFSVKVYDAVCNITTPVSSGKISLDIFEPIKFTLDIDQEAACLKDTVYINLELENGQKGRPVEYRWYARNEAGDEKLIAHTLRQDNIDLGNMTLKDVPSTFGYWEYRVVASNNVCEDVSKLYGGTIDVREPIRIELTGNTKEVLIGADLTLSVNVLSGEPLEYRWSVDGEYLATRYEPEREYAVYPKSTSTYSVIATDHVCLETMAFWDIKVKLPTILTPYDGNGLNDYFMKSYEVEIFNRYGQHVFSGNDGWNGTYRGVLADPGVYFYVVVLKNGKIEKGTIELVKMK